MPSSPGGESIDQSLFERLRQKRLVLAKAQKLPPYVIFHDRTLQEIAITKPTNLEEFSRITGVGEHKLKRYGAAFLEVISGESEARVDLVANV